MARFYYDEVTKTNMAASDVVLLMAPDRYNSLRVLLNVTAAATGTLDVSVQESADGIVWFTHTSFTQVTTSVSKQNIDVKGLSKYMRVYATIAASGVYTFTVDVSADEHV